MASYFEEEDVYYKFEILEKVWKGHLRYRHRGRHAIGNEYFRNFARDHPGFEMTVMRIYDGTKQLMVTSKQYRMMKKELEKKTGVELPVIERSTNMKEDPRNKIEDRRSYSDQSQMDMHVRALSKERDEMNRRARQDAAEHRGELCEALNENKEIKFLSFDLEVYDRNRTTMLEIGYVKFTLKKGENPEYFHAIVNEELHNQEGFDNREKFKFGETVHMTLKEAAEELKKAVAASDALLTHAGYNDKKYLADNGIDIEDKPMFDTQKLALDLLRSDIKIWSLKRILEETNIRYDEGILHNAGNDAHYTMMAFKALVKRIMPTTRF